MNTEQLRNEINKTNASLFRVSFVKANGEHRTMFCKTKIKRYLSKKPNKRIVKNVNQDIVRVFDCQSKSYKSFKLISVTELVDNIKTDLNYSILAEKQKLPISCTMYKSKTTRLTEVQAEAVIEALKAEGIVVEYVVTCDFGYFKVTELL